ncbi:MAG: DUF421 domain-containing protein [Sulfitobacter sp.]|nr:DUF421 domain-containing protein [Sulfitobacter sp.]
MHDLIEVLVRVPIVVGAIILFTRLHGLRSFSKMSGFDFAITVSFGSILAGAVTTTGTSLDIFLVALAGLFGLQVTVSQLRARFGFTRRALDNEPLLVMENGELFKENLKAAGMTEADLWSKLREANAIDLRTVHAVVVESTGDVSVLHGDPNGPKPDACLLQGVQR